MEIPRGSVRDFFSLDARHVDLNRMNSVFEHVPHYDIYRRRIRRLVDQRSYGRNELKDILKLMEDLIVLCTRDNLEKAYDNLKSDMCGRMGSFELKPDALMFEGKKNEALIQQSVSGSSITAFSMNILLKLDQALRKDDLAENLHINLQKSLRELSMLQMQTQRKNKDPRGQVVSEFILAKSASMVKDLSSISNQSLCADIRSSAGKKKDHILGMIRDELSALDERISDTLIFLSQIEKLKSSSKANEERCRKSTEKLAREVLGLSYLISEAEASIGSGDMAGVVTDNIRLNLLFVMLLLPYNEAFRGKYQSAVEGRLMQLSHYANYLKSVDFKSGIKSVFPESCTLDFEGIGELKGKRPVEIVRNIAGEDKDWKNFSPRRWKLYMQLELYLRNHLNNDEEVHAIIETKKLLVYQMLQRFTSRSIRSIESIQKTILSGDGDGLGQAYMPEDVVSILRDVCHCFSQLMQSGKDRVMGLYRFESRTMSFFKKERMPQSRYRYKSEGAVNQGKDADQKPVGEVLDALFDSLCLSCEKNVERKGASAHLDGVIREHAPSDGGLLDILDDPERLRKLMDAPIIKNQSFNRKKIIQLIQLSRSILSR